MHTSLYKMKKLESHGRPQGFLLLRAEFTALYALIAVTCVVSYWAWGDPIARTLQYRYSEKEIGAGELYRLLAAGFLHVNEYYLYGNMQYLLLFGLIVCYRTKMSNTKFLLFYLSATIFAHYFGYQYSMSYLREYSVKSTIGASGGTFAVVFAGYLLMFSPKKTKNSERKQILSILLGCYFFAEIYNSLVPFKVNGAAHHIHFGGALYGIAFTLFYYPAQVFAGLFTSKASSQKRM